MNNLFFIIAFMSNGIDTFGNQMMMMPYGGPPYSINPTEYYNNQSSQPYTPNDDDNVDQTDEEKRLSIDSSNVTQIKSLLILYKSY